MTDMQVPARWTDDCQGKKDYDGNLVRLSTRYWPRGGGFDLFSRETGFQGNETRPGIKPHATASICLHAGPLQADGFGDLVTLITQDFEADTQEEVQAQVEAWALSRFHQIADALRVLFQTTPN